MLLLATTAVAGGWKTHEVRQINGTVGDVRLPAQFQIVTESWNRVVAVPYIIYMPEKDRLLMLVNCDYPHHAEVLFSNDRGATWSSRKPVIVGTDGKAVPGMGTSLCYLGEGNVLLYGSARWFSRDYGHTWKESVPLAQASDGKPWYTWDPPLVERDAKTGKITRLLETGYTWFKPPEVKTAHQQAYLRFSMDEGKSWSPSANIPQWQAVSEVALLRAANGHLVAACRTDTPARMQPEIIDHTEGLGISISTDAGQSWSAVRKLYDWGRHHPSLILLPNGETVMTYVVRKGYVNTPDGFPQFGIEAVVSRDNGQTWDLDHKYVLHHWVGHIKEGPTAWYPSSQATSTVLLPDGSILTAFGTGYRCQDIVKGQPAPRDVGLVRWRLNSGAVNAETKLRDAPFDSDLRNVYNPDHRPAAGSAATSRVMDVGSSKQLFIDNLFFESSSNVHLKIHPPVKTGVKTLERERPWESATLNWFNVLQEGSQFRLWYECYDVDGWPTTNDTSFCYADSTNAIQWARPNRGLFTYQGSTNNNILFREIGPPTAHSRVHGAGVFLDPSAPPEARYKAVSQGLFNLGGAPYRIAGMFSADGLHWTRYPTPICPGFADSQYSGFWDARLRKYVIYGRVSSGTGRSVGRSESDDFSSFAPLSLVLATDGNDPPNSDLYNPAALQYLYATNVYLMFPSLYQHTADTLDIRLAVSRDGIHWTWPERVPFVPLGASGDFDSATLYMGQGLIRQGNELWQYYAGSPLKHNEAELPNLVLPGNGLSYSRVVSRLDGFVSAEAGPGGGSFVTPPLTFTGSALKLNVAVFAGGSVRVGLLDERCAPVTGRAIENCLPITSDGVAVLVQWDAGADVSGHARRPIKLRVEINNASVYAFQFTAAP